MAQNYYEILGVAQNASPEEIEAAFKKRAREVHPDTVAPGNAYLRQVAAEAFKDLSQAKATLLNPFEREKYDAKLRYERGSNSAGSSSSATPPPRQASTGSQTGASVGSQNQRRTNSNGSSRRAQATSAGATQRPPLRITFKPLASSLESFSFVIAGIISIFFVGWLMASGRTPPLWAAALTLALGVASFRHGLKPLSTIRTTGGMTPVLIGGYVVAVIFFAIWLPSTDMVVRRPVTESGEANPTVVAHNGKTAGRFSSPRTGVPSPTVVTVDESGEGNAAGEVTRVWMDVRDGRNYRTHSFGDALMLEVIDTAGKSAAGIVHCDFHHAGQQWTGNCSERNAAEPSIHYAEGSVSTMSDTRLEGRTDDIPEFLMVPVDSVAMGGGSGGVAEPDLSGLSDPEKQSIETVCASDKLLQGPVEYNRCVSKNADALRNAPKPPDLSHLSARERDSLELVCSNSKLMEGPTAYNQCLVRQLELMKKKPR
jgi:curved DNA-binding protein CbpA